MPLSSADRITLLETFGLDPLALRAREAWLAVRGDASVPPTRFGLSSLGIFHPALSLKTWLGGTRSDRRVPISCLFNRTPTPLEQGWSVRKTQVADFRGGALTYDSHNGTDFAVPVGTVVVASAPGRVLRISSEFNRGGLKLFIDHGRGLVTTSNHLARTLVSVGDVVDRGQPLALSGYSGIDALVAFPWSVPHVHFNVWLDGEYVDPFAAPGETSLWKDGNDPRGADGAHRDDARVVSQTAWDERLVEEAIASCKEPSTREALRGVTDLGMRAMNVLFMRNYYPTRFEGRAPLYRERHAREPWFTLPFRAEDFDGIAFAS
jgi:murein DD-endopeptidase MepM/ murein hydrolase activator NlpD